MSYFKITCRLLIATLILQSAKANAGDSLFWIDNIVVSSSPGNPLTGSGFGNFSGTFSSVTWQGPNLGNFSGDFSIVSGWLDANPAVGFGIPWSVDNNIDALVFDTNLGDYLTFGTPSLTMSGLPDGYSLCEVKTLICVNLSSNLQADIGKYIDDGASIFYGYGDKSEFFGAGFDKDAKSFESLVLDDSISSTRGLSFYASYDNGKTTEELLTGLEFDTGVKIGGCICVPEPSGALSIAMAGVLFISKRRKRA